MKNQPNEEAYLTAEFIPRERNALFRHSDESFLCGSCLSHRAQERRRHCELRERGLPAVPQKWRRRRSPSRSPAACQSRTSRQFLFSLYLADALTVSHSLTAMLAHIPRPKF